MAMNKHLEAYLQRLPWAAVQDAIDDLIDANLSDEEAIAAVSTMIDAAFPAATLVPGAAGVILETTDGPIISAILRLSCRLARHGGGRQARRAARIARHEAQRTAGAT